MIVSTIKSDGSILYHPVTKYGKGVCDCGNVFIKKATNHECCSSRCLNKRYYVAKPVITKRCIKCNKEFKTKSESKSLCKSTCGKKVDYYSKLGIRTFKCKGCNKSFESERKRLFCSKDCNKKSIAESKKPHYLLKNAAVVKILNRHRQLKNIALKNVAVLITIETRQRPKDIRNIRDNTIRIKGRKTTQ